MTYSLMYCQSYCNTIREYVKNNHYYMMSGDRMHLISLFTS